MTQIKKTIDMKKNANINTEVLLERLKEDGYTTQESISLVLNATGKQAEEIADEMFIAPTTARMHIRNSKDKSGLRKATELSGYVICAALGVDYEMVREELIRIAKAEVVKRIILILMMVFSSLGVGSRISNTRARTRNRQTYRVETLTRTRREFYYGT